MPNMNEWLFALIIIASKVIEVSISTLRIVLITKGEKKIGTMLIFIETLIWCTVAGSVLVGLSENPMRVVAYAIGVATGTFVGSTLEEKLAIGLCEIQVILTERHGDQAAEKLRNEGFAVTQIKAKGKVEARELLIMYAKRNRIQKCVDIIRQFEENAVITISDKKPVHGGYGMLKKK